MTAVPGRLRVLTYNFVQPGLPDSRARGGGVAVYHANLVDALAAHGHEVVCLSAGTRYDPWPGARPRLAAQGARAEIVNSPMFAPAHASFYVIERYSNDPGLDAIPAELRARYGRFDALHFQNIEGLTAGFFRALRAAFPDSAILVSAHNYNLVCPQVNLWFREQAVCRDYRAGRACVNCLVTGDNSKYELNIRRMEAAVRRLRLPRHGRRNRIARWWIGAPLRVARRLRRLWPAPFWPAPFWPAPLWPAPGAGAPAKLAPLVIQSPDRAADYAGFREANIALTGHVFDRVLAVSARTRDVLIARGLDPARIAVCPIGTTHAALFARAERVTAPEGGLHVGYLGYMRADKGFYFLLDVLEALPDAWAGEMSVTIAAPIHDWHAVWRLRQVAHRFRAIEIHNGYSHAQLGQVLAGVNLGIVPPIWEDNLPQVALEMVSRGIPILTSDRGGACEIAGHPDFVYPAGDWREATERLRGFATGRLRLADFWSRPPRLPTMEQHVAELEAFYRGPGGIAPSQAPP